MSSRAFRGASRRLRGLVLPTHDDARRIVLVSMLLLPLRLGAQQPCGAPEAVCARANHSASAGADVLPDTSDGVRVIALERAYWAAELAHDRHTVDSLLAPDYVSLSSRGQHDRAKAEEVELLFGGRVTLLSYTFAAMRTVRLGDDVIALHYVVDQRFVADGTIRCPHSGSLTLWRRREGRWWRAARTEYAIGTSPAECPAA